MGAKSVPIKKFRKFLELQGLKLIRTKASHEIWDNPKNPLLRPVTVDSHYPDVPMLHIHTNLKNLGISKAEFMKIIESL